MEVLQQHYGHDWEKKWIKMKKFVKKEYLKPWSKRKKRHLSLQRMETESFNGNTPIHVNGDNEMHAAWTESPKVTIRSTIRSSQKVSDNIEFQRILNEDEMEYMMVDDGYHGDDTITKAHSITHTSKLNDIQEVTSVN